MKWVTTTVECYMKTNAPNLGRIAANYNRASIITTFACNLGCPECSTREGNAFACTSLEDVTTFYRRLREQNVRIGGLRFTGGEPTLWEPLTEAIELARANKVAKMISVFSNGISSDSESYGNPDILRITNYGAINAWNIRQLKKHLKCKVRVSRTIHFPRTIPHDVEGTLPAYCGCMGLFLVGRQVYPCAKRAVLRDGGFDLEDAFYSQCINAEANTAPLCRKCLSNPSILKRFEDAGTTFEFCVWGSPFDWMLTIPAGWSAVRRMLSRLWTRRNYYVKP